MSASRWVALPWSEQLEAVVIRTFEQGDQIDLVMSNNDFLTYKVDTIEKKSFAELQSLDTRTPSLLLIIPSGNNDEDEFFVVTALP